MLSELDLDHVLGGEVCRSSVTQRTVRTLGMIAQTPIFNTNLGFQQRLKPFVLQTIIEKPVMETFDVAVFSCHANAQVNK
jgi:hypothetical protein